MADATFGCGSKKTLKNRQKIILKALWDLGGIDKSVSTRQIAKKTGFNINGISQTLGAMPYHVWCTGRRGGNRTWKLRNCWAGTL